jgi:ABC-2 type transport system permease protein
MKALPIQIQREFWEHRGLWIVPLVIAGVMLLAVAVFGHIQFDFSNAATQYDGPVPPPLVEMVVLGWTVPFFLAAAIQATAYLVDCLYGERRDRSILFWRSMPVSDSRSVLVKLLVGLALVPLGAALIAALTSLLGSALLLLRNHDVLINGRGVMALWNTLAWLRMQVIIFYGVLAAMLWYAPFATYLMLVSVWARRSPYVWASVPPVLLIILEHMIFGSNYLGRVFGGEFNQLLHLAFHLDQPGGLEVGAMVNGPDGSDLDNLRFSMQMLSPLNLLASVRLWCGLLAAGAMLALTIRLRRYRDDS